MIWLSWRQQRTETVVTAGLLVLLTAAAVPAGIHLADLFTSDHIGGCINVQSNACIVAVDNFSRGAGFLSGMLNGGWFNVVPILIGLALAAPLLEELQQGTTLLDWTQSITRRRWAVTKLGLATGTVLVSSAAFSALLTWYQQPLVKVHGVWNRFDYEWLMPVAYALLALGFALAVGVILQRRGAALVLAFVLYIGERVVVQPWLRQQLVTPLSAVLGPRAQGSFGTTNWIISETYVKHHPFGYIRVLYQPPSRFWEFQGIEFAIVTAVALLLIACAAWRVLRTD